MIYRKLSKRHFALNEVPKESHLIGLVVLSPYAAPSLATVDLVWDINHADFDRAGSFTVGRYSADEFGVLSSNPLQVVYGAVISPVLYNCPSPSCRSKQL